MCQPKRNVAAVAIVSVATAFVATAFAASELAELPPAGLEGSVT